MNCLWVEFEEPSPVGLRRVMCARCGDVSLPTASPLDRIWSECKKGETKQQIAERKALEAARRECVHRGDQIGEQLCESCSGTVRVKVFSCALHGECARSERLEHVKSCAFCPDAALALPPPSTSRAE